MGDGGSRFCRGQSGSACVGEKIQHPQRPLFLPYLIGKPVPVYRLLGKQAGVLELKRFYMELQITIADGPFFRQTGKFPAAAAACAAEVVAVRTLPSGVLFIRVPDDLRVRSDQGIIAPPFQLLDRKSVV